MDVLQRVLELSPPRATTLQAWWDSTRGECERWTNPIDRAVIGGALADRVGFAFAGGYHEALQHLVPGLAGEPASLCATEEGGNHPRAIKTALVRIDDVRTDDVRTDDVRTDGVPMDGVRTDDVRTDDVRTDGVRTDDSSVLYRLTGKKAWATAASAATRLLVIASTGERDGKNRLVLVGVRAGARGVTLMPSSASFVPEIPHASVTLDKVAVTEADIFPGDGYDDYLKPFRTIEDLHVHGALLGYWLGVARRHGFRELVPALAAALASTQTLAAADPKAETTHLALGGLLEHVTRLVGEIEGRWQASDERALWDRDRKILQVAGQARVARLARARERLGLT